MTAPRMLICARTIQASRFDSLSGARFGAPQPQPAGVAQSRDQVTSGLAADTGARTAVPSTAITVRALGPAPGRRAA
jgi:hypothetical protein